MATIILTGGGTAGHCTPHLALLPYIKNDFDKIYYIGSKNGIEKNIIESAGIPYFAIPCGKLVRKFTSKNLSLPFKVISGIITAEKIINELKPDVIFSKGGYVALPVVIAAKNKGIPVIAHESDYSVGLANKISSKRCKKVLTAFPETAKQLKNGQYVGSPIRKCGTITRTINLYKQFNLDGKKPVILVTGGSQGATNINSVLVKSLPRLLAKFDVIHICGAGNLRKDVNYKGYYQVEYLNEIHKAFAIADLCITRAGANTLFELLSLKIPCLVVPLPKGVSRGDQVVNAEYFQKKGLISVLPQSALTVESLVYSIESLFRNREMLKENLSNNPISDASRQISRILADCYKQ
ncbi:MAG: undecaprenyldiphospho-muramoylpentapeptide beta-N-acetylglucosaminyltransferase [Clostridia bacterium]|nr:undecaprenyldiphospho-muramoylpentapeptide beta-N-acetylglucosaminyltransferase [Clostridia bacterium]